MRRPLILLIPLLLVAAACGGGDDGSAASGSESTDMDMDMGHGRHDQAGDVADDARVVDVSAMSFEFGPKEIAAVAGEDLAIELTSEDVAHDFVIEELDDLHVVGVEPGETKAGGLTLKAGTYTYYCSVEGHRDAGMEGTLIVS